MALMQRIIFILQSWKKHNYPFNQEWLFPLSMIQVNVETR